MNTHTQSSRTPPRSNLHRCIHAVAIAATLAFASDVVAQPGNSKGKGKGKGKAVGQAADFVPPGHRRAPVEIVTEGPPPAVRVEATSARPSAAHLWVSGFWNWEAKAYAWTPGVWMLPPEPKAVWVPPRYEPRSGVTIMVTGFWKI